MLKQHESHSHSHDCQGLDISKDITDDCRIKLDVKISKEETEGLYKKAVKEIAKNVNVPGFRRGKAPQKMLEQNYKEAIVKEWRRLLVSEVMQHAISHVDEKPLGGRVERAELKDADLDKGATLHIEYEIEVDIANFNLKEEVPEVITDEDVEKTIDRLRHYHAQWKDVEDRVIQEGDWVALEIECIDEPKMIICSDTQFHVKKGEVAGWIFDLVIGKKLGDKVEGKSIQDDSEDIDEKIEFKPANYSLLIQKVKEPILPALDEELAKKLGAESVEDLLRKIRENLENEKKLFQTLQKRDQLAGFLCEKYPINLPQSLKEYEKKVFLQNRIEGFISRGITQDWIKENIKTVADQAEKNAVTRLRLIYILRKEAEKLGIKVLVSDLQKEMLYERYVRPAEERIVHPDMKDDEKEGRLYFTLLTEKTLDKMLESKQVA
jgi:trigger factor